MRHITPKACRRYREAALGVMFHKETMLKYYSKWILASLGFPLLVLFFGVSGLQCPHL
jgi:hypothetical protein